MASRRTYLAVSLPAIIYLSAEDAPSVLGAMFVLPSGLAVIALRRNLSLRRKLKVGTMMLRSWIAFENGTGTPFAWWVERPAKDGLPLEAASFAA